MSETDEQVGLAERTKNFVSAHRTPVIVAVIALAGAFALFYALLNTASQPPEKQAPVITLVKIIPPKPPPPPPKPIIQQKTILPQKVVMPTPKPIVPNQPPKPAPLKAPGPPPLGTSIHNNAAPDNFDLSGDTSGNGMVGGTGGGGGGGSYDAAIAADIESALTQNPKTRYASAGMQVDLYLNAAGAVIRVAIKKSSGDASVDAAVANEVLHNYQFPPPPPDKPMPIHINVNGQAPL